MSFSARWSTPDGKLWAEPEHRILVGEDGTVRVRGGELDDTLATVSDSISFGIPLAVQAQLEIELDWARQKRDGWAAQGMIPNDAPNGAQPVRSSGI